MIVLILHFVIRSIEHRQEFFFVVLITEHRRQMRNCLWRNFRLVSPDIQTKMISLVSPRAVVNVYRKYRRKPNVGHRPAYYNTTFKNVKRHLKGTFQEF